MALVINKEQQKATSFKQYTGFHKVEVIAVNPTMKELHNLGLEFIKTEPVYVREFENNGKKIKSTNITFYVKCTEKGKEDVINPITFPVMHEQFSNKAETNFQWVNKYGRTTWNADKDSINNPYFANEGVRACLRGENELYMFLQAWLGLRYNDSVKDECLLDYKKICKGDISEIKEIIRQTVEVGEQRGASYEVGVLFGVREVTKDDGNIRYYTTLFTKYFLRAFEDINDHKTYDRFTTWQDKSDFNRFGTDNNPVHHSILPEEFNSNKLPQVPQEKVEETIQSQASADEDDDLPF